MQRVVRQIKETIEKNEMLVDVNHVVLGFSGGPDSLCLLDVLIDIADTSVRPFKIHPVHVNHKIREDVCDQEQEFCEEYSQRKGLKCRSFVYDCEELAEEWGMSTEEAGRKIRYDAFSEAVNEIKETEGSNNVVVAVAQNADDQAETVLMRILRGTGVSGLGGIPYVRSDERGYNIIRPLLDVRKKEVLGYCKKRGLEPRMDESNNDPAYQRNKIRNYLIPYLEKNYNPAIVDALIRLSESAREESNYIDVDSEKVLDGIPVSPLVEIVKNGIETRELFVDNSTIKILPEAVKNRAVVMLLEKAGLTEDITYEHFKAVEKLIDGDNPSARVDLPRTFYARREYDKLYFGYINHGELRINPEGESSDASMELNMQKLHISELDSFLTEQGLGAGDYAAFDEFKLVGSYGVGASKVLEVRSKRPGDVMRLNVGTKKLQDILVDAKVPLRERDRVTVVAIGNEVLWLLPYGGKNRRWSSEFRIDHDTEWVAVFYVVHL